MAVHAWDANWASGTKEQFLAIRREIVEKGFPDEDVNGIALCILERRRTGARDGNPSRANVASEIAQTMRPETVEKYSQLFEDMVYSGKNFSSLDEIY